MKSFYRRAGNKTWWDFSILSRLKEDVELFLNGVPSFLCPINCRCNSLWPILIKQSLDWGSIWRRKYMKNLMLQETINDLTGELAVI